ncbi:hypothetical protein DFLDMN_000602 [Cupriavidus sp. H19C3]
MAAPGFQRLQQNRHVAAFDQAATWRACKRLARGTAIRARWRGQDFDGAPPQSAGLVGLRPGLLRQVVPKRAVLDADVLVKPIRSSLKTNLVITTNRRTYLIELTSTNKAWMASVSWEYPKDQMLALQRQDRAAQAAAPIDSGLSLEKIRFRYAVSGSNPPWKPQRAFDDGEKVYIQFPPGIAQGELPPLFVIGAQGDGQLVNYRFRSPYYIVDRLFGAAELRLGGDKGDVVRIERTDGTRGN